MINPCLCDSSALENDMKPNYIYIAHPAKSCRFLFLFLFFFFFFTFLAVELCLSQARIYESFGTVEAKIR